MPTRSSDVTLLIDRCAHKTQRTSPITSCLRFSANPTHTPSTLILCGSDSSGVAGVLYFILVHSTGLTLQIKSDRTISASRLYFNLTDFSPIRPPRTLSECSEQVQRWISPTCSTLNPNNTITEASIKVKEVDIHTSKVAWLPRLGHYLPW